MGSVRAPHHPREKPIRRTGRWRRPGRRRAGLVLAAVLATATLPLALGRGPASEAPVAEGPSLGVHHGRTRHVFGPSVEGDTLQHVFELVSDGDEDLVIEEMTVSCRCTKPRLVQVGEDGSRTPYRLGQPLPPGARLDVVVRISTEKRPGKWTSHVYLVTNAEERALELLLDTNVEGVFVVEPSLVVYPPSLLPGEELEGELVIRSTHLDPYILVHEPAPRDPALRVQLEPIEPDEAGRSRSWRVRYRIGPDLPEGLSAHPIALKSDVVVPLPKRPRPDGQPTVLEIEPVVYATVEDPVRFRPRYVSFGPVPAGEVATSVLRLESADGEPLAETPELTWQLERPRGLEAPALLDVSSTHPGGRADVVELTLRLRPPAGLEGSFRGLLVVSVGHPRVPRLRIPFGGVVRP